MCEAAWLRICISLKDTSTGRQVSQRRTDEDVPWSIFQARKQHNPHALTAVGLGGEEGDLPSSCVLLCADYSIRQLLPATLLLCSFRADVFTCFVPFWGNRLRGARHCAEHCVLSTKHRALHCCCQWVHGRWATRLLLRLTVSPTSPTGLCHQPLQTSTLCLSAKTVVRVKTLP